LWRGKKYEDRYTQVAVVLWKNLAVSHAFFTSSEYAEFHKVIQPGMNGRKVEWQYHALIGTTGNDDMAHLLRTLESPAIEVALTKVVEGGVAGYYSQFRNIVVPILDTDPGCDGHFISPQVENPQHQLLLINWRSVGVRTRTGL
jgi:heme-degrading monooxygenase HmoA